MKTTIILLSIIALVISGNLKKDASPLSHFLRYIKQHNKDYSNVEEFEKRFKIFAQNLNEEIDTEMNFSPFMDLSDEEFDQMLGYDVTDRPQILATTETAKISTFKSAPESFDWRDQGAVTPVKNQGLCGSCWTFSAIGNIESQQIIVNKKQLILSEQELVDCDLKDNGCKGGLMDQAFEYLIKNGVVQESDYPYKAARGTCRLDTSKVAVKVTGFKDVSRNEDDIKEFLFTNGPLSIAVNARPWKHYQGGIFKPHGIFNHCSPKRLDHGVLLVGYGEENGEKYWIIKNSWGTKWGEDGYIRLERGVGACGVNTNVSTAAIAKN